MKVCFRILAGLLPILLMASGCKDRGVEEYNTKPFALKGASNVLEALAKNNYDESISGLVAIKGTLTEKDFPEYSRLRARVFETLATNESEGAQEAYRALGVMERGR